MAESQMIKGAEEALYKQICQIKTELLRKFERKENLQLLTNMIGGYENK